MDDWDPVVKEFFGVVAAIVAGILLSCLLYGCDLPDTEDCGPDASPVVTAALSDIAYARCALSCQWALDCGRTLQPVETCTLECQARTCESFGCEGSVDVRLVGPCLDAIPYEDCQGTGVPDVCLELMGGG